MGLLGFVKFVRNSMQPELMRNIFHALAFRATQVEQISFNIIAWNE